MNNEIGYKISSKSNEVLIKSYYFAMQYVFNKYIVTLNRFQI